MSEDKHKDYVAKEYSRKVLEIMLDAGNSASNHAYMANLLMNYVNDIGWDGYKMSLEISYTGIDMGHKEEAIVTFTKKDIGLCVRFRLIMIAPERHWREWILANNPTMFYEEDDND